MRQIKVTIILKGHLMWYSEGKKKVHEITISEGLKIIDALHTIKVPIEQINIVRKNGEKVSLDTEINEGDQIEIVPIIAGG